MVFLQLNDHLELFVERKEFLPGSNILDRTQAVEKRRNNPILSSIKYNLSDK